MGAVELSSPQPYTSLSHTADAGIEVSGASAEEALGRLVLAYAQMVSGDEAMPITGSREISVPGGADLALIAIDLLRAVHEVAAIEGLLPATIRVLGCSPAGGARVTLGLGRFDRQHYPEGLEIKAITYHHAYLAAEADGLWHARAIVDI